MPKQIDFEGQVHEFPDDFTDADIAAALAQVSPAPSHRPEKSVGGLLSNAGGDVAEMASGIGQMVLHPIDTAKAISRTHAHDTAQAWRRASQPPPVAEDIARDFTASGGLKGAAGAAADQAYERPVSMAMALAPMARPILKLGKVKRGLEAGGVRTMRAAVKTPTSELSKVSGSVQQGLDATADDVARTFLREGVNPGTAKGLETLQQRVDMLGKVRDTDIAAAPQVTIPGSGQRQLMALKPVIERARQQSAPGADVNAVADFGRSITTNPRLIERPLVTEVVPGRQVTIPPRALAQVPTGDAALIASGHRAALAPDSVFQPSAAEVRAARELGPAALAVPRRVLNTPAAPPQPTVFESAPTTRTVRGPVRMKDLTPVQLNTLNKGDNRALSGLFGKVGDAEIDARKAVVESRRAMLDEAVPGTRDLGQQMSKLITGRNVANVMRRRTEGNNPVTLTDFISLTSGHPEVFALSTAMKPAAQAAIGGTLYRTGAALPSQIDLTALYRMALLQQLIGAEPPAGSGR
jgi:hypothetical protein